MGSSRRYLGPVAAMVAVFLLCAS
ncbi:MAG: hypothetical protein QOJ49_710, partial [Actinomycetota bacterium]|nr:hypothetical protein [Actinomycetota bacterium]